MTDIVERLKERWLECSRSSFDSVDAGISANLLDDTIDEIESLRAASEWRDISTAPMDGATRIDVWFQLTPDHGERWAKVTWSHEHKVWTGGPPSQYPGGWIATHWMPIPAPPQRNEVKK